MSNLKSNLLRTFLLLMFAPFSLMLQGQWDLGDYPPNIRDANVLTGDTIDIREDYRREQVSVLLFVFSADDDSARTIHSSGILQEINTKYGFDGYEEVAVLYVEKDGLESKAVLEGENALGYNWTDSIGNIPIISLKDTFPEESPQLYLICFDGFIGMKNEMPGDASEMLYTVGEMCGGPDGMEPTKDIGLYAITDPWYYCESFVPRVWMHNHSAEKVNNPVIEVWQQGQLFQRYVFPGSIAPATWEFVTFDTLYSNEEILNVEYRLIWSEDGATTNNITSESIQRAPKWKFFGQSDVLNVLVKPDVWGEEVTWSLEKQYEDTLLTGGPYENNAIVDDGQWHYSVEEIITDQRELLLEQSDSGCYVFTILDDYYGPGGPGIYDSNKPEFGYGYYEFQTKNEDVLAHFSGDSYFSWGNFVFEVAFDVDASIKEEQQTIRYYPQPVRDVLHIELSDYSALNRSFEIHNVAGQLVTQGEIKERQFSVEVHNLPSGVYVLHIPDSGIQPIRFNVQH